MSNTHQSKLKIVILTSSLVGTPTFFIPAIFEKANVEIVSVIVNQQLQEASKKSKKKRVKKILKIDEY